MCVVFEKFKDVLGKNTAVNKVAAEFAAKRGKEIRMYPLKYFFPFYKKHREKRRETNMEITWMIFFSFFQFGHLQ